MKVTNDTNSRKVEPRLAIYLGRSNGDESPSLDSPVIAAGPTSLCYLGGLDNIPARFVNDAADNISNPLTHMINLSLHHGKVPDDLKSKGGAPFSDISWSVQRR